EKIETNMADTPLMARSSQSSEIVVGHHSQTSSSNVSFGGSSDVEIGDIRDKASVENETSGSTLPLVLK
ncbi:hypothetical protein C0993_007874, partial [Termitomyces sp. T159_Od127]